MASLQGMLSSVTMKINVSSFSYCAGETQITRLQEEVQDCNAKICQLSLKLKQQDNDILYLREEVKKLLTELSKTRIALKNIVDKL